VLVEEPIAKPVSSITTVEAAGKEVNEEIISKLTGKAAQYFASLF
jgi:hypothetical protein